MSITPRGMSTQEAYRLYRDGKLVVNRKYQRKLVWSLEEKQALIDSLVKDYPVPLILLAEAVHENGNTYEIIDGMQRLNAIFAFFENDFDVEDAYFDTREFSRAQQVSKSGLFTVADPEKAKFLDPGVCADLLDYQLAVTVFPIENEMQVTDVFGRINSGGRQLSSQEKRQAGRVGDFSSLVRELGADIRGDASRERLPLSEMPEISIDSVRAGLGYSLKSEEIFWCKQGIIWAKHLRDSEDEEILADIAASIVFNEPIARSRELFNKLYDPTSPEYEQLHRDLSSYGIDRLKEEIKVVMSVLGEVISGYGKEADTLRSVLNPKSANPVKGSFFAVFMAFHRLVIVEEKSPEDYEGIMSALKGLQKKMISSAKYSVTKDRIQNVDLTGGLIQKHFVQKDPPMLRHGAGLALDMENSLRRSRIETGRYECKQGLVTLSEKKRELDGGMYAKLINTICGIANMGPDADGFLFLGVADSEADAERIKKLDSMIPVRVGNRYVVGVGREMELLSVDEEQYLEGILGALRSSDLSEPLKSAVLSHLDYVEYKGLSVVRIRVPAQEELSFVGDKAYVRENSSTVEATGKKLLAANKHFGS